MQPNKEGIASLIRQLEGIAVQEPLPPPPPAPPLNPPGGGGSSGGMEPRIARLEAQMEHVQGALLKLSDVPANLATLIERVAHLPTKEYLVKVTLGSLAIIAALVTFSDKLHSLVK